VAAFLDPERSSSSSKVSSSISARSKSSRSSSSSSFLPFLPDFLDLDLDARAGGIKSPLFNGGGRVFGPRPRDYSFKLNKKVKDLARISALTYKAKDNAITVLEDFNFEAPKTKNYVDLMKNLNLSDKKTLLVLGDTNKNVYLSSRNLQGVKVVKASDISTYDILHAETVILAESSVKVIENILNK